KKGSSSKIAQ
ncbi:methyltransferase small domain protein, partial [Vibrio parahaemolyticus EKP-021]